jgi:HAD superfamily hydrolase (TIGR01549 family)
MIKGIIFDCDGVILDSNYVYDKEFIRIGKKYGANFTRKDIYSRFGKSPRELMKEVYGRHYSDNAYDEFIKIISSPNFSRKIKMFKDAKASLKRLKKHYKLFLATGGVKAALFPIMKRVCHEKIFDIILTSDDVHKPSPKTEMIKIILKKYGLGRSEVVYVGDAHSDVHAARTAGVKCIIVLTGAMNLIDAKKHGPDFIAESINDVEALVKSLNHLHSKL